MRTLLLLCLIGTMSCMAFGQTYEYLNVADDGDYEIMGMKGGFGYGGYGLGGKGGFGGYGIGGGKGGYGGFGVGPTVTFVQPVVQQAYAPVTLTKNQPAQQVIPTQTKQQPQVVVQPIVQPVIQQAQPIVLPAIQQGKQQQPQQFQIQQAPVAAPTQQKSINYAQPIVTYAQPIVQQLDMTPPKVEKQYLTAQAIVQPTFQTAPVQTTQAITATAPTIQKGYGGSTNLGSNLNLAGYGGVGNLAVGGVDY